MSAAEEGKAGAVEAGTERRWLLFLCRLVKFVKRSKGERKEAIRGHLGGTELPDVYRLVWRGFRSQSTATSKLMLCYRL